MRNRAGYAPRRRYIGAIGANAVAENNDDGNYMDDDQPQQEPNYDQGQDDYEQPQQPDQQQDHDEQVPEVDLGGLANANYEQYIENYPEEQMYWEVFVGGPPQNIDLQMNDNADEENDEENAGDIDPFLPDQPFVDRGIVETEKVCPNWDINEAAEVLIYQRQLEINAVNQAVALDDPLVCAGQNMTRSEFACAFKAKFESNGVSENVMNEVLELVGGVLQHHPDINLPVRITQRHRLRSDLYAYDPGAKVKVIFHFHLCPQGCTVFQGDNANLVTCPRCTSPRFKTCSQCFKRTGDTLNCTCPIEDRIPTKTLNVRSLRLLLFDLLHLEWFIPSLQYTVIPLPNGVIADFKNAAIANQQLEIMTNTYEAQYPLVNGEVRPIFVPIFGTIFYDGARVYENRHSIFWPLVFGIENLIPECRADLGKGRFMLALFTAIGKSAERFLMRDCLVEELKFLERGWEVEVRGVRYFIVVQVSLHLLDVKALEKYLQVNTTGTYAPCFRCRSIQSTRPAILNKLVLHNHRPFSDDLHFTRYRGQTALPCPLNFYEKGAIETDEGDNTFRQPVERDNLAILYTPRSLDFALVCTRLREVRTAMRAELGREPSIAEMKPRFNPRLQGLSDRAYTLLLQGEDNHVPVANLMPNVNSVQARERFVDYHSEDDPTFTFNRAWFDQLYYRFCELRPQRAFGFCPDATFIEDAFWALENGRRKNGVNGLAAFWDLFRFSLKSVPFDPFHAFKNTIMYILDILDGERNLLNAATLRYCQATACFSTFSINEENIWRLTAAELQQIDAWINCIAVPKGRSQDFQIRNLFQHKSFLRGTSAIQLCTCGIIEIMLLAAPNLPIQFRAWLWIFSRYTRDIFSNTFNADDPAKLERRGLESIILKEGVLPESESVPCWHQTTEMAKQIPLSGPLRNASTVSGERAVGELGNLLQIGGSCPDNVLFNKYIKLETIRMRQAYDNYDVARNLLKGEAYEKRHVLDNDNIFRNQNNPRQLFHIDKHICFSHPYFTRPPALLNNNINNVNRGRDPRPNFDYPGVLAGGDENNAIYHRVRFTTGEMNGLLLATQEHIHMVCYQGDLERCYRESSWYRVVEFFMIAQNANMRYLPVDFQDWVCEWNDRLSQGLDPLGDFHILHAHDENIQTMVFPRAGHHLLSAFITQRFRHKYFYYDDLRIIRNLAVFGIQMAVHRDAKICSIDFEGRGFRCRENGKSKPYHYYGQDTQRYVPVNVECNTLSTNWFKTLPLRCWCKLTYQEDEKISDESVQHYGTINFFVQLIVLYEPLLHGCTFASIACHKAVYVQRVPIISGFTDESFCGEHTFVSIRQLDITNLGMLPFDRGNVVDPARNICLNNDAFNDGRLSLGTGEWVRQVPEADGRYIRRRYPSIRQEFRNLFTRSRHIYQEFKPFFLAKFGDSAYGATRYYSEVRNLSKLSCIIPSELDSANVGWKWMTAEHDNFMRRISDFSRSNAVRISCHTQDVCNPTV